MKLSYRDRIILLIVLVVAILLLGVFVFIKPQWEALNTNKKTLEDEQKKWSDTLLEFGRINSLREKIQKNRDNAEKISKHFADSMDATELDQFIQKNFLNSEEFKDADIELMNGFDVKDAGTTTMSYYYYKPSVVTYPLYERADFDGSLKKAVKELNKEADALSARSNETVGVGTSSFTLKINKEYTDKLIDKVREYAEKNDDAMAITSVTIAEYDFNGTPEDKAAEGEDAAAQPKNDDKKADKPGYTEVAFNYQVYYMQEPTPVTSVIGPEYDSSLWDGKEWKSYSSPNAANSEKAE